MDVSKLDVDAAYEDLKDLLDSSIEKFYEWNQKVSEILNDDDDGMEMIDGFVDGLLHRYLKERMGGSNE
jgi:cytochrome b involved in lipid metabolism